MAEHGVGNVENPCEGGDIGCGHGQIGAKHSLQTRRHNLDEREAFAHRRQGEQGLPIGQRPLLAWQMTPRMDNENAFPRTVCSVAKSGKFQSGRRRINPRNREIAGEIERCSDLVPAVAVRLSRTDTVQFCRKKRAPAAKDVAGRFEQTPQAELAAAPGEIRRIVVCGRHGKSDALWSPCFSHEQGRAGIGPCASGHSEIERVQ